MISQLSDSCRNVFVNVLTEAILQLVKTYAMTNIYYIQLE